MTTSTQVGLSIAFRIGWLADVRRSSQVFLRGLAQVCSKSSEASRGWASSSLLMVSCHVQTIKCRRNHPGNYIRLTLLRGCRRDGRLVIPAVAATRSSARRDNVYSGWDYSSHLGLDGLQMCEGALRFSCVAWHRSAPRAVRLAVAGRVPACLWPAASFTP